MSKLTIKYKDDREFFVKYLGVLSPMLKLAPKEREILAQIMYEDYNLRDIAIKNRYRIILSYEGRVELYRALNISNQTFRNAMGVFRREGYLNRDKENVESLAPFLIVDPEKMSSIVFNFVKDKK